MATVFASNATNFDKALITLIDKRLEDILRAPLIHLTPGNFRPAKFVKGTNNTLRYLAFGDMDISDAEADMDTPVAGTKPWLTEGTPPTSEDMSLVYEEFSANQAGRVIKLTDIAMEESPWDLIGEASDKVARNAIETMDKRVARVILAGTNYITANAARPTTGTVAAGDLLTGAVVKRAVAILKGSNVPTFPDGTYHGIIHPYVSADLQADADVGGWIDAARYAGSTPLLTGELGRYAGVRFAESSAASVKTAAGAGTPKIDVYSTVIFGPEAYAFGDWGTIRAKITPPGGHEDPLEQSALVGWKARFGAKLIVASGVGPRYLRIESATGVVGV